MTTDKQNKESTAIKREVVITNPFGMHARPAAFFVKVASKYDCEIMVEKNGVRVSAKSVMGLMGLSAECGSKLMLEADGPGAEKALDELEALVKANFHYNEH